MAGITSGTMFVFRFQTMSVFLVMALGTIHCPGSFYGLVIFIYHTRMTILTRYLTPVNGSLIPSPRYMKPALRTPLLMASDTILRRVAQGIIGRKQYEQPQKIEAKLFHTRIPSADFAPEEWSRAVGNSTGQADYRRLRTHSIHSSIYPIVNIPRPQSDKGGISLRGVGSTSRRLLRFNNHQSIGLFMSLRRSIKIGST